MKCKSCARGYSRLLRTCPFCGTPSADNVLYPNCIAKFLARPRDVGNLCVTNMNILFVFAINLSIAALVVNLFTFNATKTLWCHYVICAAFGLYGILRGSFGSKLTALRTVRDATLLTVIALAGTAIAYNFTDKQDAAISIAEYAIPSVIIGLGVVALLFLFLGLSSSISFAITTTINTAISGALLITSLVASEIFLDPAVIYTAFGFSVFTLSNYLLLFGLSFMTKVKRGF